MFGRNGCWTVAQKMLDIERRLDALEKKKYFVYEHNLSFYLRHSGTEGAFVNLKITNNNATDLSASEVMANIYNIPDGKSISITGFTQDDKAVCAIANGEYRPYVILSDSGTEDFDDISNLKDYVVPVEVATV